MSLKLAAKIWSGIEVTNNWMSDNLQQRVQLYSVQRACLYLLCEEASLREWEKATYQPWNFCDVSTRNVLV